MAVEKGLNPLTFTASTNLSARQYRCVNLDANGEVQASGAAATFVMGVLQNDPTAQGQGAAVETFAGAVTKVHASTTAGTAINEGSALISGLANGIAEAASTGGTAYVWGRAIDPLTTGSTGIISAMLTHEGPSSTS